MTRRERFQEKEQAKPINPNNQLIMRLLAAGYCLYCVYRVVTAFIRGGEGAPGLWFMVGTVVLLGGGAAWIIVAALRQYLRQRQAEQESLDAVYAPARQTEEEAAVTAAGTEINN